MRIVTPRITRRHVLRAGAVFPFTARHQAATPESTIRGTHLRILTPKHPLSAYDDAVRTLAMNWAAVEGLTIELDVIPASEISAAFDAEVEVGSGHDLVATHMPLLHHAGELRDLSGLYQRAAEAFGPPAEVCDAATRLPDGRRPAFSIAYAPAPLVYRRSIWEAYGLPNGPASWDQVRETGAQLWNEEGMNVGFGLSAEPGSERVAAMLLAAYGSALTDEEGEVVLDSAESVEAVRFAVGLFRDAMSPESLDWGTDRPARLVGEGIASVVSDDISAIRLARSGAGEIGNDLFLAPPLAGPAGVTPVTLPTSFRAFHIPAFAANPDAAEAFLLMLVASSEVLVGAGQLIDRPAYGSLVPGLVQAGGWLDSDPYGADPKEKFAMLKGSAAWTAAPSGALEARAHATFLLARMMARVARGSASSEAAVSDAAAELREMA